MLNKINVLISFVFCFISFLFSFIYKDVTLLLFSLYIIIPFILKLKPIITFLYLIFGFLALFLGFQLHLYKTVYWYDNFAHFLWGFLSSLLAIIFLKKYKKFDNIIFNCLFIFIFSLATSGLWELCEFTIDNIFNSDMQRRATGVYDTMKDIIIALFGNILFILSFIFEYKNKKLLIRFLIDYL